MLINLTVRSVNYENKTAYAMAFESSEIEDAVTKVNSGLDGTAEFDYRKRHYSVTESLDTLTEYTQDSVKVLKVAQQDLSGPGAITITEEYSAVTTTGADALTLVDGTFANQKKTITLIVDGGDGTLTPANIDGGTTIVFADAGDSVDLIWDKVNGYWVAIKLYNTADGVTAPVLA